MNSGSEIAKTSLSQALRSCWFRRSAIATKELEYAVKDGRLPDSFLIVSQLAVLSVADDKAGFSATMDPFRKMLTDSRTSNIARDQHRKLAPYFAKKSPHVIRIRSKLFRQDLHRHQPIQLRVFRQIDFAHPARSQRPDDLV